MLSAEHDVVLAQGGADAISLLQQDRGFQAIICDLSMPEVDGPMVHEAIAEHAPELMPRLVFCSGGAISRRMEDFCSSVGVPVLQKPISREELCRVIEQMSKDSASKIVHAQRPRE